MRPYTFSQICIWLGYPRCPSISIAGVSVDSRLLKKGELFFALPGAKIEGHTFLGEVAAKGACGAVIQADYAGPDYGLKLLRVPDVLEALQTIASQLLKTYRSKIIAVTGSMGKTTTKDLLTSLLKKKFRVGSSPGNSNSQVGVPLALLNHTQGDEEILVLEMGMTHPGNIRKLVQIAPPTVAIITTTELVHACNFENLGQIGLAKAEIFSHPQTQLGVLDHRIVNSKELLSLGTCAKRTFGVNCPAADYSLTQEGNALHIRDPKGEGILALLPIHGEHNKHNFLGAAAVARELGMEWEEINSTIPTLELPERRMQFVEKKGALFVNDAYNANVSSIKAALRSLPEPKSGGKRIALLSEMAELGKFSQECHKEVGKAALEHLDLLLCFGPDCRHIQDIWQAAGKSVEWFLTREEAVEALRKSFQPGDVVLLKGSRSKQLDKVLEEI